MPRNEPDIDGWWVATSGELAGIQLPADALSDLTLRLSHGTFRLGTDEGCTRLDRHARPKSLDLILTRGPNRGRIVPAIVDLAADSLRICCDLSGITRPEAFTAPPGTRRFLARYRRALPVAPCTTSDGPLTMKVRLS